MHFPWTRRLGFPGAIAAVPPNSQEDTALFTVDLEEYFHASVFEALLPFDRWPSLPSRIEWQMEELLALLEEYDAHATFFILGWIAERFPDVVRRIHAAGHEVASHGFLHRRVRTCGPRLFREEIRESRAILESVTGASVIGYRAPNFSITPGCEWALDVLLEEGYLYDSSLFPIYRPGYGHAGAMDAPFWIPRLSGQLLEVPPTTISVTGVRLPAAGGAYLRHLPYGVTRYALANSRSRVLYIHPWELDPYQPRISLPWPNSRRHYGGIRGAKEKLRRALQEFRFTSIREVFDLDSTIDAEDANRAAS